MKIIGGFIIFLALYGFSVEVTLTGVLWLFFGIFLSATKECLEILMHTIRRANREQK
jgi:hypothetical protein